MLAGGADTRLFLEPAQGLISPKQYFSRMTREEAKRAFEKKFGPARSSRPDADTYYNPKTGRSFNVHQAPGHQDGKPHVDIRHRGKDSKGVDFKERKYLLHD